MSIDRTSSLFMPFINSFYPTISWLGITKEELIDLASNSGIDFNSRIEIVRKEINELLKEKIQVLLNDDHYAYDVITKYIESLVDNYSQEEVVDLFKDLDKFFKKYDYIPNKQVLGKLFKDNVLFLNMVKMIDKECGDSSEECKEIIDNPSLMLILEAYYELYNKKYADYHELLKSNDFPDSLIFYLKEIEKFPLLSFQEEQELYKKIYAGDKLAKEKMINSNLKLVVSVAARYRNRGLSFSDLIQEGNIGLIKAIDYFDASRGYKFSTYAWQWIRQYIGRAVGDQGRNIRIPVHVYEKVAKYRKQKAILTTILDREPTMDEMANRMEVDIKQIEQYESLLNDTISLNTIINEEDDTELQCFISSGNTVEDEVINKSLRKQLAISFIKAGLTDREKDILMYRFGLVDGRCWTLEEVGKKFNVTRERIRQLEVKAIKKLRNPKVTKQLLDYTSNIKLAASNVGLDLTNGIIKKDRENIKEPKKTRKGRKKKFHSAYGYFEGYSEEEINKALARLNERDNKIFNDYDKSFLPGSECPKELYSDFLNMVRPKLTRCLEDPDYVPIYRQPRKQAIKKPIQEEMIITPALETTSQEDSIVPEITPKEGPIQEASQIIPLDIISEEFTKANYNSMLELLKSPSFTNMLSVLSPKEAVIISLRLGYIDNKCFSPSAISKFLSIEEDEVNDITKKVLSVYKSNFNAFVDGLISGSSTPEETNKQYTKLPKID